MNSLVGLRRIWRTLRFRLAVWNALVVAVIAIIMLVGVRQGIRWALYHEMDQTLIEEAREISIAIQDAKSNEYSLILEDLSRKALGHQQHGWFAELFDQNGNLLWSSEETPFETRRPEENANLIPYTWQSFRVIEMRLQQHSLKIDSLRIGAKLDFIRRDIVLIDRLMFLAASMLFLIAPLCGYWLAGQAARTVGEIIHTAGRLRPSHLEERLKLRGTGDELDQLAHTINGLLDRIAVYIQLKRDFLANAAHELRTPLAAIRSSIEVALNRAQTCEEYEQVLEDLIDQSMGLETLVNQLLLLSETETDSGGNQFESVPLNEVVIRAMDMFRGVAETKDVSVILESLQNCVVSGNRQHLRQVINNLLDNAIKYTPQGGQVRVRLERNDASGEVRLSVEDSGIGISENDLPHVFDRFFRADRSRTRSLSIHGTGLGLSICQAVVQAHGGNISCKSPLQKGTTLEVTLPMQKPVENVPSGEGQETATGSVSVS